MADTIVQAASIAQIQSYLTGSPTGFAFTSMSLQGTLEAVGVFDSLFLGQGIAFGKGVLLTTGSGVPARTNTSNSYTVENGLSGDSDLTRFAQSAFNGAGETRDASILTITFTIDNPNVKSLKFDVAFGSEEYPEFSNSSYVDIGAIWTGTGATATNYALVNNNPDAPLSVTDSNVTLGNFISNLSGGLTIEYDGILNRQSIFVPVTMGQNVIKIGVADTGDSSLDSGLFLLGIEGTGVDASGTLQGTQVSSGQSYDAGSNNSLFNGSPGDFNGTKFSNFDDLDQIFVNGFFFSDLNATLGFGSLVIRLDTDNNGQLDTTITLEDPVINATVTIAAGGTGTGITLAALQAATDGNDTINGTAGLDYIGGGIGNDILSGLGGSDVIYGGLGNDTLDGGSGIDTAGYRGARAGYSIAFDAATGLYTVVDTDLSDGDEGTDTLANFEFASFAGTIAALDPSIVGPGSPGGGGNGGGGGAPALPVVINGTIGDDTLDGNELDNVISAGGGRDLVHGRGGSDLIYGGGGPSDPTDDADVLYGDEGSDTIFGNGGDDVIYGGLRPSDPTDGADIVFAGVGNDTVYGNGGDDILFGNAGRDLIYGGIGNDAIYGGDGPSDPNDDADVIFGGEGSDLIFGNGGDDVIFGGQGPSDPADLADSIFGGRGNDILFGNGGDDILFGNEDDDTLIGGRGNDELTGGTGADRFYVSAGDGTDTITDFNLGEGDRIGLGGQTYTARQVDGGTVLDLSGGGNVLLQNVTLASLSPDFFI